MVLVGFFCYLLAKFVMLSSCFFSSVISAIHRSSIYGLNIENNHMLIVFEIKASLFGDDEFGVLCVVAV
jgi:hypothetical protein